MSILSIAWKDLQILAKDRNSLISTFLLPVVFILVFLGVAGAGTQEAEAKGINLPVVNGDAGGEMSALFMERLEEEGGVIPQVMPEAEAMDKLETEDVTRVLFIPAGFTEDLNTGKKTEVRLLNNALNDDETSSLLISLEGVAQGLSLERQIIASLEQMAAMQAGNPQAGQLTAEDAIPRAEAQFESARGRPLVEVRQKLPSILEKGEEAEIGGVQIAVPGFAVLFVFLTAQVTARSVYYEKKSGSFRRLLAAPLSNAQLLLGKMLPNFIVVLLQMIFIFAAGIFLLPLIGLDRLNLGNDILALILIVVVVALCSTTLGILISAIARTEAQIGGYSGVILWVLGFLGGAFIPLFLINETMAALGKVTPHYWAVTGFYDLLTRGHGLSAITDSLAVLAGFTLLFFVVGAWRFDFE